MEVVKIRFSIHQYLYQRVAKSCKELQKRIAKLFSIHQYLYQRVARVARV